jgi:tetratricopeptide (TPR) repeat protein
MTSRLLPRVLEGKDGKLQPRCHEVSLKGFSSEDAVKYFQKEEIKATRAEIIEICSKYDYHPLSLSLLVGLINEDHEKRGDIAAMKNLEIFEDVRARRHHVLERAYGSLAPERRDLLSKISCFRGSMEYAVLKKVFPSPDLDKALLDLRKRGLLQYAGESGRYDMHPIVRHYAYDHFTDEKRRKEAHVELAMHFIDVMPVTNKNVKTLEDLAPVIELYHHMVGAGNLDEAVKLFYNRLNEPLYYQLGAYQVFIELQSALFDKKTQLPKLKNEFLQARVVNDIANAHSLNGRPQYAAPIFQTAVSLIENMDDKKNVATGLGNLASMAQIHIGALSAAERNLRRQIDLCREIEAEFNEAVGYQELGRVLSYRGLWQEAEQELEKAQRVIDESEPNNFVSVVRAYRSFNFLLQVRGVPKIKNDNLKLAIQFSQSALEISNEHAIKYRPTLRDFVREFWLLGAAYRANNELTLAEENLSKALNLCRQINMVDHEADILLDTARLRYAQGEFKDAHEKVSEALVITERSGYVLQGADVNLFLAQYALEQEKDNAKARAYAEEAKKLATCDGPPYYYKVAYEEAEAMLEKL